MKKALIIGGSGFLGSHIADALSEEGYSVEIYDRSESEWLKREQKMTVGTLDDLALLRQSISGVDVIYHFAGIADIGESAENPADTIRANILGVMNVLEMAVEMKVSRFVYASSMYVYSDYGSFYRASKQSAELIIEAYHEKYGLEFTILRYGSLYGPRSQNWNGLKRYVTQAVNAKRIVHHGTSDERREYIHVTDAARLSVDILGSQYRNRAITVTGHQVLCSGELLEMIEEICGHTVEKVFEGSGAKNFHYKKTPYKFTPRIARKIVPDEFIDIGQGILEMVEEIYLENDQGEG